MTPLQTIISRMADLRASPSASRPCCSTHATIRTRLLMPLCRAKRLLRCFKWPALPINRTAPRNRCVLVKVCSPRGWQEPRKASLEVRTTSATSSITFTRRARVTLGRLVVQSMGSACPPLRRKARTAARSATLATKSEPTSSSKRTHATHSQELAVPDLVKLALQVLVHPTCNRWLAEEPPDPPRTTTLAGQHELNTET